MTKVICNFTDCYYNKSKICNRNSITLDDNDSSANGCIYYVKYNK